MKGNKLITLLLIITIFTVLMELEGRVRSFSKGVYDRFLIDLKVQEAPDPPEQLKAPMPILSSLRSK